MQKKWLIIVDVFILIVVILVSLGAVWNFSFEESVPSTEECIDVNKVSSFVYDVCYDAYSENIFMKVDRGADSYRVNALRISFFDFSEQFYELTDVPDIDGFKAYKILAKKNPQTIDVRLDITKDFSAPVCDEPRMLSIKYCPASIYQEGVNVSVSPLKDVGLDDFIEIGEMPKQYSDTFSLSLVDKERIWKSQCESRWECGIWGDCVDGVQNRECEDIKNCFMPTNSPEMVRYCGQNCSEEWECEWSGCSNGFTEPKCIDLNKCGTSYNIPQKLGCGVDRDCMADIECSEWSSCDIDYNFADLIKEGIGDLSGVKSRMCKDNNGCVELQKETRSCSVSVDIYTQKFTKCGEDFIGIYNRLNNDLIARIKKGTQDNPHLDIYFDDQRDSRYCDYCFDGKLNGDEEGVDCGGSCEACVDKYKQVSFVEKTWWNSFNDWVEKILM
ncbi:MAG: hypothetical protein ABIF18_02605 [archaeon]